MRKLLLRTTLLGCLGAALLAPATAAADPVQDCSTNGTLTQRYSAGELASALRSMPADVKEYTDCYDQIRRAQLAAAAGGGTRSHRKSSGSGSGGGQGGSGTGGGSGGSTGSGSGSAGHAGHAGRGRAGSAGASRVPDGGAQPVRIGDRTVTPGTSGLSAAGADVPTPLVVVLALLAAGGLAFAATRIRSRVADRRGA